MPKVMCDEKGPWMDLGEYAIRPTRPTRIAQGGQVDVVKLQDGGLHGVGGEAGGLWQEAWIVGPPEGGALNLAVPSGVQWRNYCRYLGEFARANPGFASRGGLVDGADLMKKWTDYALAEELCKPKTVASVLERLGALADEGEAIARRIATRFEADAIRGELAGRVAQAKRKPGL
jgi:hypothetical protein